MINKELIKLLQADKVGNFNQLRVDYPDAVIDLRGVDLRSADLSYADLQDADLQGAILRNVDFRGANLIGVRLIGADLEGAIFDKSQIAMLPKLLRIKVVEDNNE